MLTVVVYLITVLSLIYYLLKKNNNYWKLRGIPQDHPYLFFGNLYNVVVGKQGILERITEIYLKHKNLPYVGFYALTKPVLMVNSPDLIKRILVKDFDKFTNRNVTLNEHSDPVGYHSLFGARDQVWRDLRMKIAPIFSSGKMKMMLPLMAECAQNLQEIIKNSRDGIVDVKDLTKRYAIDVISSCAFGINANCLKCENSEIYEVTESLFDQSSFKRSFSSFSFFFLPKFVDIFGLTFTDHTATKYLMEIFKTTFNERKQLNIKRNDLIDLLDQMKINESVNDNYKFDDIKMAAQAIIFFTAGNETISIAVVFTLYELALKPEIQNKLREEIQESYNRNNGFNYETIQEMEYLNMVINETIRRYPTTTFLSREAIVDYTIEETGHRIQKGTSIMIPVCGIHFDPEYFPNPQDFDPERYNNENRTKIKPFTYIPFGEGPRNCIGKRFGLLSTKIALVHLLKDFRFDISERTTVPTKIKPKAIFLQPAAEIYLKVSPVA